MAEASRLLVVAGGSALLAETDELIGAEEYVLRSVRDLPTARRFLTMVGRRRRTAADCSAEGNPSGGNLLRGVQYRTQASAPPETLPDAASNT